MRIYLITIKYNFLSVEINNNKKNIYYNIFFNAKKKLIIKRCKFYIYEI
jgi:hypothetical protein